jgi:cysteine desulfurase/selenocysteine lyase
MEHHSNLVPWQMLCLRKGATLKMLPFDDEGMLCLTRLDGLLTERTRLIALPFTSNVFGVANPVKDVIARARARGIPVLVDGAQAVQHCPVDVQDLDCDFFAFSGHKMYAETGIGVLYGKERWLERMPPPRYGGGMIKSVRFDRTSFADLPFKLEAGTPNIGGAASIEAAADYLEGLGREAVAAYEHALGAYAHEQLSGVEGLRLYGAGSQGRSVFSFNLEGLSPYDVSMIVDKLGIAVRSGTLCAEPVMRHFGITGAVRASIAVYNTTGEIDALVAGLGRARDMLQ